jgi:glycosyltransferase involved in cell wall biosynthesis
MIVTIHDITFEQRPEWYSTPRRIGFRMQARHAARTARRILTPSAWTRDEVCACYGVEPERIVVARNLLGPEYEMAPPARPAFLDRLGVDARFVIAVGGAPRRGMDMLAAAWMRVHAAAPDVPLVVVGSDGTGLPAGAVGVGRLSDDEWRGAVAAATLLCYPTAHEGFGYPALEACALGTPVVCGTVGALPEVLGSAARWVTPLDAEHLAAGVLEVLDQRALRDRLVADGRARAAAVDKAAIGRAVLEAYEATAER